jgi:hypothetical protein
MRAHLERKCKPDAGREREGERERGREGEREVMLERGREEIHCWSRAIGIKCVQHLSLSFRVWGLGFRV